MAGTLSGFAQQCVPLSGAADAKNSSRMPSSNMISSVEGCHAVAAEIAQEITMLFKYSNIDASTRKQKTEHHAGRTSAYNAATNFNFFHKHILI